MPEQAKALFFEGIAHFEAERFVEAEQCFESALLRVPGRVSVLSNLGVTQFRLGKWAQAQQTLIEVTAADPQDRDAWTALGLSQAALAQWAGAVDALKARVALSEPTAAIYLSLGQCLARLDRVDEALAAYQEALQLDPRLAMAWSERGNLLRDARRYREAAHCFEEALAHGADQTLHEFYLASVRDLHAEPPAAPRDYVEALFDQYADAFDTHLVKQLNYQAHDILLAPLRSEGRHFSLVLDLGCGTGLCGQLINAQADAVDGVDLSAAMVQRAQASGVYRQVAHGDLVSFLQASDLPADLILAADVFIYVGALDQVFAAVRRRLRAGGQFAFSLELNQNGKALELMPSLRYSHSADYIHRLAQANGLRVVRQIEGPLREDQRRPVPGLYCYLE